LLAGINGPGLSRRIEGGACAAAALPGVKGADALPQLALGCPVGWVGPLEWFHPAAWVEPCDTCGVVWEICGAAIAGIVAAIIRQRRLILR